MKKLHLALALASLLAGTFTPALGQTVTWAGGGGDSSRHNAANWSGGAVPGPTNDVIISSVGTNVTITIGASLMVQERGGLDSFADFA